MRNSFTRVLLGAGFAGAALLSLSAAAWSGGEHRMHHDPARMVAHLADRLELSEGQRTQVEQQIDAAADQHSQYRDELTSLREQLRDMRENFDPDTARSITDRIGEITADLAYEAARSRSEIYAILNETQRAKMEELMEKRASGRSKWHRRAPENRDEEKT